MVRNIQYRSKYAFTMIELIFAIVIIAISVMSLPMVTQVTNKGIENSLAQEAVFAASADLMGVTSAYWDERSLEDSSVGLSRVIDISADCNDTTKLRPGHIAQAYHRRCVDSNLATGLGATADTNITALDDMVGTQDVFLTTDAATYKEKYTSTVAVTRTGDVKAITVTIKKKVGGDTITSLKAQIANIGEVDIYKRTF